MPSTCFSLLARSLSSLYIQTLLTLLLTTPSTPSAAAAAAAAAVAARYETYYSGEDLFGLPHVEYPDIQVIKKELEGLNQLYGLYDTVIKTIRGYEEMLWVKVVESVETMENEVKVFQGRARQLPKDQKDWPAYVELKKTIDDFLELLPLMQQFSHPAILPRHWQKYMEITGREFRTDKEFFKLSNFLLKAAKGAAGSDSADPTSPAAPSHGAHDLTPLTFKEELEDLALGAVKERIIEDKLGEIKDKWSEESFTFQNYKARGMLMLGGTIGEKVPPPPSPLPPRYGELAMYSTTVVSTTVVMTTTTAPQVTHYDKELQFVAIRVTSKQIGIGPVERAHKKLKKVRTCSLPFCVSSHLVLLQRTYVYD